MDRNPKSYQVLAVGSCPKEIKTMVLKTGPDRPVGSVQPSTGELSGSVRSMNRFVIKPALNRSNRRLDRRTRRPVRFFANRS